MTMVFMKVAVAEDPAHSASRKPRLTTSARPEPRMSDSVGATRSSTTSGVSTWAAAVTSWSSICRTDPLPDNRAEVAERAEQPDQQGGHGQDLPERRLGGEPEDAVLPR